MTNKPFDSFIVLAGLLFGVIMLVAGFAMGQPMRIVTGMLFVIMGLFLFVALKRRRR